MIYIINLDNIMHQRLLGTKAVCINHFLCHKHGMETTPLGITIAGEILRCMMWARPDHVESIDCHPIKALLDRNRSHYYSSREKSRINAFVQLMEFVRNSSTDPQQNELFILEGNIRRRAPPGFTVSDMQELLSVVSHHVNTSKYLSTSNELEFSLYPLLG